MRGVGSKAVWVLFRKFINFGVARLPLLCRQQFGFGWTILPPISNLSSLNPPYLTHPSQQGAIICPIYLVWYLSESTRSALFVLCFIIHKLCTAHNASL